MFSINHISVIIQDDWDDYMNILLNANRKVNSNIEKQGYLNARVNPKLKSKSFEIPLYILQFYWTIMSRMLLPNRLTQLRSHMPYIDAVNFNKHCVAQFHSFSLIYDLGKTHLKRCLLLENVTSLGALNMNFMVYQISTWNSVHTNGSIEL